MGTKENPAYSCIDLLKNGDQTRSGIYWIKEGNSVLQAYCDQETDGGGWTLFFSYNHKSYENPSIKAGELPISLCEGNSHINLNQIEIKPQDV